MADVILTIHYVHAASIAAGLKSVEFRKSIWKKPVDRVFLCVSKTKGHVFGWFSIADIITGTPSEVWEKRKEIGLLPGISHADYLFYAGRSTRMYGIVIENYFKIVPFQIQNVPQSWRYAKDFEVRT